MTDIELIEQIESIRWCIERGLRVREDLKWVLEMAKDRIAGRSVLESVTESQTPIAEKGRVALIEGLKAIRFAGGEPVLIWIDKEQWSMIRNYFKRGDVYPGDIHGPFPNKWREVII